MQKLIEWSKDLKKEVEASAEKNTEKGERVNINAEIRRLIRAGLKSKK